MADMHRYLVDTNVLIDLAVETRPSHAAAMDVISCARRRADIELALFMPSLKDAYYVMHRHYKDEKTARGLARGLCAMFVGVGMDKELAELAFACDEPDFEDGLVRVAAEVSGCEGIISRDVAAFRNATRLCRISPEDFCRIYN